MIERAWAPMLAFVAACGPTVRFEDDSEGLSSGGGGTTNSASGEITSGSSGGTTANSSSGAGGIGGQGGGAGSSSSAGGGGGAPSCQPGEVASCYSGPQDAAHACASATALAGHGAFAEASGFVRIRWGSSAKGSGNYARSRSGCSRRSSNDDLGVGKRLAAGNVK